MDKLANILTNFWLFRRFSVRQKLLSMLYVTYLWNPMRKRMLLDQVRHRRRQLADGDDDSIMVQTRVEEVEVSIPEQSRLAIAYQFISAITHSAIWVNFAMLKFRSLPEDQVADDLFFCFSPRIHFHGSVNQDFARSYGLWFSAVIIAVKLLLFFFGTNLELDVVSYLLMIGESRTNGISERARKSVTTKSSPLDKLIFYEVDTDSMHRKLRLRPNRTSKARENLAKRVSLSFTISLLTALTFALGIFSVSFTEILSRQEPMFVGCRITYWDWVYWFRALSSICLMLVLAIDVLAILTLGIALVDILIFDISVYWIHIERKLYKHSISIHNRADFLNQSLIEDFNPEKRPSYSQQLQDRLDFLEASLDCAHMINTDHELVELRWQMNDFFSKVRQADKMISLVLFCGFFTWLTGSATTTFIGVPLLESTTQSIIILCFHAGGLLLLFWVSYLPLRLEHRTRPAHEAICSLMALDPSLRKADWIKLLAPYSPRRRSYSFTFFGSSVFDTLMFLKLTSYTLTLVAYFKVMQSLKS